MNAGSVTLMEKVWSNCEQEATSLWVCFNSACDCNFLDCDVDVALGI